MRRRTRTQDDSGVPRELQRFVYEDWADESEVPPPHWDGPTVTYNPATPRTVGLFWGIRAHQRWLDAKMKWSADNRVCIHTAMGDEHAICNLCWIADGRMKVPQRREMDR